MLQFDDYCSVTPPIVLVLVAAATMQEMDSKRHPHLYVLLTDKGESYSYINAES
jgi:hypothetical protein